MKFAYDLCGAEPIIKDTPVYDAATVAYGELLMLGATAFSAGADAGFAAVSACPSTVMANAAVDAIGLCLETKTTADSPSVATAHNSTASGGCYVKTIINPFAVYRAEVSQSDELSIASTTSTNNFAVTGIPASAMNGSWVYFSASAGPNHGELRKVVTSATGGTQNMDSAVTNTVTTADKVIIISEKNKYPHALSADALTVGQTTVAGNGATNLRVVENYIEKDAGFEILRNGTHKQIKIGSGTAAKTKFYQDLVCKDHIFGAQEA